MCIFLGSNILAVDWFRLFFVFYLFSNVYTPLQSKFVSVFHLLGRTMFGVLQPRMPIKTVWPSFIILVVDVVGFFFFIISTIRWTIAQYTHQHVMSIHASVINLEIFFNDSFFMCVHNTQSIPYFPQMSTV